MNPRQPLRHEGTYAAGKIITGDTLHRPSRESNQARRDGPPRSLIPAVYQPPKGDEIGDGVVRERERETGRERERVILVSMDCMVVDDQLLRITRRSIYHPLACTACL